MAETGNLDVFFSAAGVDLSDHLIEVTVDVNKTALPKTAMGDSVENFLAGLGQHGGSAVFNQDFAANEVDATFGAAAIAGTVQAIIIRPTSAAVSTTNPNYTGNFILTQYQPIAGRVNETMVGRITFVPSDGTGFSRATS